MVGPVLIFAAVGITASLGSNHVVEYLNSLPYMNDLLHLFGKLLPYLLVIAAFTFVYMLVPNTRVRFGSALYGAVVAGVLWGTTGIAFAAFVGGSGSYAAIYSSLAILLVFMIWLYIGWVILLIGASISFYHQNPEYLKWAQADLHISAATLDQLALQAMYEIAVAHDEPSLPSPTLKQLAASQQVPVDVLRPVLDALEGGGLLQRSSQRPPVYLPASSPARIGLFDVVRCARRADDRRAGGDFRSDAAVDRLLELLQEDLESRLGRMSLADLIANREDDATDEDSLV